MVELNVDKTVINLETAAAIEAALSVEEISISLEVDHTVINLEAAVAIEAELSVEDISISIDVDQIIPAVELVAGIQGPEGAKGDRGEQGIKGDSLTYGTLTEQDKAEIIAQYDQVVGSNSYTNVFLNALLS